MAVKDDDGLKGHFLMMLFSITEVVSKNLFTLRLSIVGIYDDFLDAP